MAYSSISFTFGEIPSAAKWNILGTNDAYFDSLIGSGTAWTSWTPTLSGRFTNGDWTKTGAYQQFGKIVFYRLKLVSADATPMAGGSGEGTLTLPVTANTAYIGADQTAWIGGMGIYDSGTAVYSGGVYVDSAGAGVTAHLRVHSSDGTNVGLRALSSTVPMTWATSDEITISGTYGAA